MRRQWVKRLKYGEAPESDNILNEIIKYSADCVIPYLRRLLNVILDSDTFLNLWSNLIIAPLHKSGTSDLLENYRGFSLINAVSNTVLHIVNDGLQIWADNQKMINEEKVTFRRGYSSTDNIVYLEQSHPKVSFSPQEDVHMFCRF